MLTKPSNTLTDLSNNERVLDFYSFNVFLTECIMNGRGVFSGLLTIRACKRFGGCRRMARDIFPAHGPSSDTVKVI